MHKPFSSPILVCALVLTAASQAQDLPIGRNVDTLLTFARSRSPEYTATRLDADAAGERIVSAAALPDPRLRVELRDITRSGEQAASVSPSRVGSTRYLLMQDLPWYGKRDLRREIAELEAETARGKASEAWADLAAKIKAVHAQRYLLKHSRQLSGEILDGMTRLQKIAQVRYAGGLGTQQDVLRAQIEQTGMKSEILLLEAESRQLSVRLNALLGRPPDAELAAPEALPPLPPPAALDYAGLAERLRLRNPSLRTDEARVQAAQKTRELTRRNRYPDFTVGISPIQYQNALKEWELMVEMNLPWQQSSRRAQEREAETLFAAANSRRDATANRMLADLADNLAGLDAAREAEKLADGTLLPQAQVAFRSALASYESGKIDLATLLEAQRRIRQAGQARLKAQVEARMRLAEIERLLGEEP